MKGLSAQCDRHDNSAHDVVLARYRDWFYAAAGYKLVRGAANVFLSLLVYDILDMQHPRYTAVWQVVGMYVMVYAPAYRWAARFPTGTGSSSL